ncbi:hypothetical protein [Falsibacillus albus]|uniref:Uncharacterized protein n=1 Tax=Falsibacillus albus TaxID=2478915 RepID=A0A3L7K576_9BACI|nr:hypothetical protein [Falsibacillus albus]RLQ97221.1 hypothetical protein D9X91_03455 [Falsibacillus albus]
MVTKAAVCCPARERWGENGHQSGRLMIESRALGVKTVIKEEFDNPKETSESNLPLTSQCFIPRKI